MIQGDKGMREFLDVNGHKVQLIFEPSTFSEKVDHVFVICKYENNWLLTNHKTRGWEFPGGKVEKGESPEDAAHREVWEETGASIEKLTPIGSYKVTDSTGFFIKKVFLGIINGLEKKANYLETNGPVLIKEEELLKERFEYQYSFIMQDQMIELFLGNNIEKNKGCLSF
jgi:8-oxo-dGTP diphosphatase